MSELSGTKLRIVDCSIELFAHNGYGGVSVRDIAAAVGIKDASIYSHFASKGEILTTIYNMMREVYLVDNPDAEALDRILVQCSPLRFTEIGFQRFKKRLSDPKQANIFLILQREKYNDSRVASVWREYLTYCIEYMAMVFSKMIEKGWIRSLDTRQMGASYMLAEMMLREEYAHCLALGQSTAPTEKRIKEHNEFFLGLVAQ